MRLDHVAYRVADRYKTAAFFERAFEYSTGEEFQVKFDDGSTADCLTLVPARRYKDINMWKFVLQELDPDTQESIECEMHAAPEIFVSDGPPGSIVGDWVSARDGVGGIHHMAYQVDDVQGTMDKWKEEGYAEFLSEEPLTCPGLTQIFTKPSQLTGVIYELISREDKGFCVDNVKNLMTSTRDLS
jgi:catechol 2,3-dioxygenase-like lactoylglutathione lyase family enzyme